MSSSQGSNLFGTSTAYSLIESKTPSQLPIADDDSCPPYEINILVAPQIIRNKLKLKESQFTKEDLIDSSFRVAFWNCPLAIYMFSFVTDAYNVSFTSSSLFEIFNQIDRIIDFIRCINRSGSDFEMFSHMQYYDSPIIIFRIKVPNWFVDLHTEFRNALDDLDLRLTAGIMPLYYFKLLSFCLSRIPIRMELDKQFDNQIKLAAIRKKIKGNLQQLDNLCRRKAHYVAQDNLIRSDMVDIEIQNINDRINSLKLKEVVLKNNENVVFPCNDGNENAMEVPGEVETTAEQAENTLLETATFEDESSVTEVPPDVSFTQEIFSDQVHQYPALTKRFERFFQYDIDRSVTRGQVLATINLPYDFIAYNLRSPVTNPFLQHEFFTGGMEIKFVWNLAKTQQLYVQFGVVWHLLQRDRYQELQEVHPVSQQPGGFLNGHMANSTIINIDYLSFLPVIPTSSNNFVTPLYYASITIVALTPFEYGPSDTARAQLVGYARFKDDLRFYGLRETHPFPPPPSVERVIPCMMATAALAGSRIKRTLKEETRGVAGRLVGRANNLVKGAVSTASRTMLSAVERTTSKALPSLRGNRDKPTNHDNHPLHQRTSTNIASGSGHFDADSYRLTTNASVPHPPFLEGVEKFSDLKTIASTFGFVNSFRVSKTNNVGDLLYSCYVNPGNQTTLSGNLYSNQIPIEYTPVDHLAALFRTYAGDLEHKFISVNNGFTTCRLRIVWIPGDAATGIVNFTDSDSFYFRVFDIGPDLETQLTFTQTLPYIFNFINYPLVTETNNRVYSGILQIFLETPLSSPEGVPDGFDILVFRRAAENFELSIPSPCRTKFIGGPADGPGQQPPNPPPTYILQTLLIEWVDSTVGQAIVRIINQAQNITVTLNVGNTSNYHLIDSSSYVLGANAWDGTILYPTLSFTSVSNVLIPASMTVNFRINPNALVSFNMHANSGNATLNIYRTGLPYRVAGGGPAFDGEIDDENANENGHVLPCNDGSDSRFDPHGLEHYAPPCETMVTALQGENFMDLSTNLRRFEHYESVIIHCPDTFEKVLVYRLLVNTGASSLRTEQTDIQRQNKVTMFGDVFRFARTSIRFVVSVRYQQPGGILFTQHVPLVNSLPTNRFQQLNQSIYEDSGYGEQIHALQQNPVFSIEIPLYTSGNCLLNASYLSDELAVNLSSALGFIKFHYFGPRQDIVLDIKRAVGDDMQLYGFNGFPIRSPINYSSDIIYFSGQRKETVYPCMNVEPALSLLRDRTQDRVDHVADEASALITSMRNFIDSLTASDRPSESLTTMILQICQIINNPTVTTFALSVTQILVTLRIIKFSMITSISNLFSRYIDKIGLLKKSGEVYIPAMVDDDLSEAAELSAVILSGVAGLFHPTKKVGKFESLVCSFSSSSSIHHRILEFLNVLFRYVKRCSIFICEKFFPESSFHRYLISDGKEVVKKWVERTQVVTDPTIYDRLKQNANSVALLYWLISAGEELALKTTYSGSRNTKIGQLISSNLISLKKVREKISRLVGVPNAKYDPYVLYLSGPSCIGKSILLETVCTTLAHQVFEIKTEGVPFFTVPTDKYWEAYNKNEVILFDDFQRMVPLDPADSDVVHLCGLKGNAQFVIPKAFEDKGVVSVAKLIGCASNFPQPTIRDVKPEVICNRRNMCWKITTNFNGFVTCPNHNAQISLACPSCVSAGDNAERLKTYSHLLFQQHDPLDSNHVYGVEVLYDEFLRRVLADASLYHKKEAIAFQKRLAQSKVLTKASYEARERGEEIPIPTEFVIPNSPFDHLDKVLTEVEADKILASLGGPIRSANIPAMFTNFKVAFGLAKDTHTARYDAVEEEVIFQQCHHASVSVETEIVFNQHGYHWPSLETRFGVLDNTKCSEYCIWEDREADYFADLLDHFKTKNGCIPKFFPRRFQPVEIEPLVDEVSDRVTSKSWYDIFKKVDWFVTTMTAVVGIGISVSAIMAYKTIKSRGKNQNKGKQFKIAEFLGGDVPETIITEDVSLCLMASDDVKTLFRPTPRKPLNPPKLKFIPRVNVKPTMSVDLDNLVSTYERSCYRVECAGKYMALFVSIAPGVYITQFHALAKIITCCSEFIKGLADEGKCRQEIDNICTLTLWKKNLDGALQSITIPFSTLIAQNLNKFHVMYDGSDMSIFNLHIPEFTTQNLGQFLMKNSQTMYLSSDNKMIATTDIKSVGRIEVPVVEEVNTNLTISNEHAVDWCPGIGDGSLSLKMLGFRTQNPWKDYTTKCGSILIDKTMGKIIGIMSCATKSSAYFNYVSYELFSDAGLLPNVIDKHGNHVRLVEETIPTMKDLPSEIIEKQITIPKMQVHQSVKTTLRKSVSHEVFGPVVRAPCQMATPDDPKGIGAIVRQLHNYVPHKAFPENDILSSFTDLKNLYQAHCRPVIPVKSERTIREAIEGIDGHIVKLKMSTSPGFPWSCRSDTSRKSDLLTFDETNTKVLTIHQDLLEMVKIEEQLMDEGIVPFTVHQIALKDERLKLEKLHNVRIIQGSPFSLTISSRKFLMDFNYAFQCSRDKLEHAVGINPESDEWNTLATRLLNNSNYICVGDYSKFGPRLLTQFVEKSYEIMNIWYSIYGGSERDNKMRTILGKRVVNSRNIVDRQIITLSCGSPSGAINTVVINSMCNSLYIRCAWIGIMRKLSPKHTDLKFFNQNVCFYCYGDDVIFSVTPEFIRIFNNSTIHEYFAEFDIKYTDVDKNGQMRPFCSIYDATFLKNGFAHFKETSIIGGLWIPRPNMLDILDSTNWVRKPKGMPDSNSIQMALAEATYVNCENSLRKMWFWGRENFEEFKARLDDFWKTFELNGKRWKPPSFDFDALQLEFGFPLALESNYKDNEIFFQQKYGNLEPSPDGFLEPYLDQNEVDEKTVEQDGLTAETSTCLWLTNLFQPSKNRMQPPYFEEEKVTSLNAKPILSH